MSIKSSPKFHKTSGKQLRLAYYEGGLLVVNDSSNVLVNITNISGDRYKLQFKGTDKPNWFTPSDNIQLDERIFLGTKEYEWSINAGGEGVFKIHVPEQDYYWVVPDAAGNQTKITLSPSAGRTGELFSFVAK